MTDILAALREKRAARRCWGCDHAPHPQACPAGECLCYGQAVLVAPAGGGW